MCGCEGCVGVRDVWVWVWGVDVKAWTKDGCVWNVVKCSVNQTSHDC